MSNIFQNYIQTKNASGSFGHMLYFAECIIFEQFLVRIDNVRACTVARHQENENQPRK